MIMVRLTALLCAAFVGLIIFGWASQASAQAEVAETLRVQQGCRDGRGDQAMCVDYGHYLYQGVGTERDEPTALRLWIRACEAGDTLPHAIGCSNASSALRSSGALPRDYRRALALASRACSLGSGGGCWNLGILHRDGLGTAVDGQLAYQSFDMACGYRNAAGCRDAGALKYQGILIPRDENAALSQFRTGCAFGDAPSCSSYGFYLLEGRVTPRDAALGVKHYRHSCRAGVAVSCSNLEGIRAAGPGSLGYAELMAFEAVDRAFPPELPAGQRFILASAAFQGGDVSLAMAGFEVLAEEGMADAAFHLGQIHYSGQGVAQDIHKAVRYFEQAANAGHPHGRFVMARFYRTGFVVAHNEIWAIQLMRAAHEEGGIAEAAIWQTWQDEMNARYDLRDQQMREMARENAASQAAADSANMARIWGLYSSGQNRQENGQVCGTIYRNNQANHECMARETFDNYYNPNR